MKFDEIKKSFSKMFRDLIILSAILILVGLFCMIFPQTSAGIICYIIGAALCVFGILRLIVYFASDRQIPFGSFSFIEGIAFLIIGVFVLLRPEFLQGILVGLLGISLIADGALKLQYSIDLLRIKSKYWYIVFIMALLSVAGGIVVLLNPFAATKAIMIFTGICLVLDGGFDLFSLFYIRNRVSVIAAPTADDCIEAHSEQKPDSDSEHVG